MGGQARNFPHLSGVRHNARLLLVSFTVFMVMVRTGRPPGNQAQIGAPAQHEGSRGQGS